MKKLIPILILLCMVAPAFAGGSVLSKKGIDSNQRYLKIIDVPEDINHPLVVEEKYEYTYDTSEWCVKEDGNPIQVKSESYEYWLEINNLPFNFYNMNEVDVSVENEFSSGYDDAYFLRYPDTGTIMIYFADRWCSQEYPAGSYWDYDKNMSICNPRSTEDMICHDTDFSIQGKAIITVGTYRQVK